MPKQAEKLIVRQQDSSDCGVACLLSLIRYYGGQASLERLRELSGTAKQGTTLLGLHQAANQLGFDAQGCEAEGVHSLMEHGQPTILHIVTPEQLQHYAVWYNGLPNDRHLIGDPAKGLVEVTTAELDQLWVSRKCLTLNPNEQFVKADSQRQQQKEWLLSLLRDDAPLLIAAAVFGLGMALLGMAMSIFSQRLIDNILPSRNLTKLIAGTALVGFLLLVRVGLEALRSFLLLRQSKAFNNRIIGRFYERLLHLPKAFFDSRKTGDLVARMNDTARIQRVIGQLSGQVIIDVLVVLVAIGFLFAYSWQVATALLFCLPLYFWLIYRFHHPINDGQRQVMGAYAINESNYISTLQGVAAIKAFNRQTVFSQVNQTVYGLFQERIVGLGQLQLRLNAYASVAGVFILISVLAYASFQVLQQQLKVGELMAILGMASSLLPSVANLALLAVPLNEARVAFDRMFEFVSLAPESDTNTEEEPKPLNIKRLQLQAVTFRFPGRRTLLENISLQLNKGEIIGLVGESGSGKSTILQLIERFYAPESGQLVVNDNYQLHNIGLTQWRQQVALVPQDVHLFNGTLLDNILLGTEAVPETVEQFCQQEPFLQFIQSLPQGLMTLVGEEGLNLSGGQKQWVGLMRALFANPQLLLLDEATAALDAHSERQVLDLLQQLRPRMGIVFVTHRLHTLPRICDRIYVLDGGTLHASGTHTELLTTDNLYSRFWQELAVN